MDTPRGYKRKRGLLKRITLFLVFFLFLYESICASADSNCLKINFLDVDEGDSILIETPGGRNILIDTGNLISGFKVAEYLKKKDIENIDHLIFTHPDFDHIGGAFFISQMLKVKNVYDNGEDLNNPAKTADIYRWYTQLIRKNNNYRVLKAKDKLSFDGVILQVLWPPQKLPFSDPNNNSIVILLEYGKFRALLTGDLSMPGERELLKSKVNLKADVLKVGHHGAVDANSEEFLKKVSPKIAIISVNKANIFGYPAQEVIKKIKKAGATLYRTDNSGDIVLSIRQVNNKAFEIKINK